MAEEKLTTAELSALMKRVQVAVNVAKEREQAQKKKAQTAKKALPKGVKMGSYKDDADEDDGSYDAYSGGAAEEKFVRPTHAAEADFM